MPHHQLPAEEFARRVKAFHASIDERIEKYGHTHISVFPSKHHPGSQFTYSIGLAKKDRPELIVMGNLAQQCAMGMICDVANSWEKNDGQIKLGINTELFTVPVLLREVTSQFVRDKFVMASQRRYGKKIRTVQIIWADDNGFLPGERGYNSKKFKQIVLPPTRTPAQTQRALRHGSRREKVLAKRVLQGEQQ